MAGYGILILVSVYLSPNKELFWSDLEALFSLGDAVIFFGDFNNKSSNWNCNYTNRNGRETKVLAKDLHFNIVTPLTPTYYPTNVNYRPNVLDIALMKGVALKLSCIEPFQCLNSDHQPVLMRLGSFIRDCPRSIKTFTNWQKVSTELEEINTPILNNIPNDIVSTDDIDNAIGALTDHIRTVVENSSRTVSAKFDRRELPKDVSELIRAKNVALRRAGKYPTCENKSHARALQQNPPYGLEYVRGWKRKFVTVSLPPKDDLDSITHDETGQYAVVNEFYQYWSSSKFDTLSTVVLRVRKRDTATVDKCPTRVVRGRHCTLS
ncbi:RNA-directed DNA polymerase from mobile element jockey [Eumeta japonica]|uniref:RNA-directed DNA polymerase from mobile element jockey n=1 Tax=Eumeta variegata TaxID=151549 RepID=A0A4C1U942_EUMVA|nr:RNA-directed DNA polymerase from mobile element jockey [Eumeta japonica]